MAARGVGDREEGLQDEREEIREFGYWPGKKKHRVYEVR